MPADLSEIADFSECINANQLVDMTTKGVLFTWENKRDGEAHILSRIDQVLVNEAWMTGIPNVEVVALVGGVSDHSPILVSINNEAKRGNKPFKFFYF